MQPSNNTMLPLAPAHLLIALCLLIFCCLSKAQIRDVACDNSMNFTSGGAYQKNLNTTLASLASNASLTGYYTSTGQNPDTVYGLIWCPGFVSRENCQSCSKTAASDITQLCPNQKEAFMCNENCTLRYSNTSLVADNVPRLCYYNMQNPTDQGLFNTQLGNLLKTLSTNTAVSPSRSAVWSVNYTALTNIYGMGQCVNDLSESDCFNCLQTIISYIPQCSDNTVGSRMYSLSCLIRYEIYPFSPFSFSTVPPPLSPSPPQPSSNPSARANSNPSSSTDDVSEEGYNRIDSLMFELNTLREATGNFCNEYKLGQGGFGAVYKGKLREGREIAVKRLSSSSGQGLVELKTEVTLVARLLHRNLVRLLGFCLEEEEKLLVYEYLPNGSLDKVLRYKIIIGIARGLLYLHEDSQLRIIHRDLKASNILLGESMIPKISDFGLARLFPGSQTQGNTNRIAGTYGYMAPEYVKKGHFSTKSDVYSFGILVLEIITGQKNSRFRDSTNLQTYAWKQWTNGTALELLDPTLADKWQTNEVLKCIHIGLLCVQEAVSDRPAMSQIVMMLSSDTITCRPPSKPGFFVSRESFGSDSGMEDAHQESLQHSINQAQKLYAACDNSMNFTSGDAYQENLNTTLASLTGNASLTSYYTSTTGQNPDTAYGLIWCPAYISRETCQSCSKTAASNITQLCPNQREAIMCNENCTLRYSDTRFFSVADNVPRLCFYNRHNPTDQGHFNTQLGNLLRTLSTNAAVSPSRSAVGTVNYTDFATIYGMGECVNDLSESDCFNCLQSIIGYIPQCSDKTVGSRIFSLSCLIRYEIYPFFTLPIPTAPPPASPSPPQPKPNPFVTANSSIPPDDAGEEGYNSMDSLMFQLNTLREATENFCNEYILGQGGFGPVYKGKLRDGREIAVKRLSSSSVQGLEELKTEVTLIARLLHQNLVSLLGFCLEEEEKLLVNILLDESMNPKISDFGLARLFPGSQTQGNTSRIAGTYGYMAPEYIKKGHFSTKSDVYSFGILVLETITGQKNSRFRDSAWKQWINGTALECVDPTLENKWQTSKVLKCIHIGLLCVQEAICDRPAMSEIVMMLSSDTITCPPPSRPGFFVSKESFGSNSVMEEAPQESLQHSINQFSITEVDPR
ncbi:hypothetical protein Tsubulata_033179 [Turnera subulata]|uniref:Cysteine-rich receptor-like protein kinase n=1 Tax=Turnera subulata TaxID=218843 RepID=A0A9Q0FJV6_9ROSI|nr:hypothetical protein Tsubulata_033179 [Turnera subulata]